MTVKDINAWFTLLFLDTHISPHAFLSMGSFINYTARCGEGAENTANIKLNTQT